MELSEIYELNRVLNSGFSFISRPEVVKSPKGMIEYNMSWYEELESSPPCSVPVELENSFQEDMITHFAPAYFLISISLLATVPSNYFVSDELAEYKEQLTNH